MHPQLEKCQVSVAIISTVLALLCHIILKDSRCLGIVPIETVENNFDMFWPVWRRIKGDAHDYGELLV